jgi:hypothetical protein
LSLAQSLSRRGERSLIGRATDIVNAPARAAGRLLQRGGDLLQGGGKTLQGRISERTAQAMRDTQFSGEFFRPETWSAGDDPSVLGVVAQSAVVLGNLAPVVLAGLSSIGAGAVVGGLQGGQSALDEIDGRLRALAETGELQRTPLYLRLRDEGFSDQEATEATIMAGRDAASLIAGGIAAVGGALTSRIAQRGVTGLAARNALVRIPGTALVSAVEEGSQELLESVAAAAAANLQTGANLNVMENSFANFAMGALAGAPIGVLGALERESEADQERRRVQDANRLLTPEDRDSPLPNSAILDGKLALEAIEAGQPLPPVSTPAQPVAPEPDAPVNVPDGAVGLDEFLGTEPQAEPPLRLENPITEQPAAQPVTEPEQVRAASVSGSAPSEAPVSSPAGEAGGAAPPVRPERVTTIYTPDDSEVEVETMVVEAADLLTSDQDGYPQELQPRDRDRPASETQIESIANKPNPRRLDQSPESDRGSPIIGADGRTVESGNGRVIGLRRAYARGTTDRYRAYVEQNYPEAAGMTNPVIVRVRRSQVGNDFTTASNNPATLELSASERARSDANLIDEGVMSTYRGGGIGNVGNRDMIRAFIAKLPQTAQGSLVTKEGGLTIEGQRRFQTALFQRAYGDERLLARFSESMDNDMRAVTEAMSEAAGRIVQMKVAIERGEVDPAMDITPEIVRAVQDIADFRTRGETLRGSRDQADAFAEPLSRIAQMVQNAFFDDAGKNLAAKAKMETWLEGYVEKAMKEKIDQGELAGVEPRPRRTPEDIANEIARTATEQEPADLFAESGATGSRGNGRGGPAPQGRPDGASRPEAGTRPADGGGQGQVSATTKPTYIFRPVLNVDQIREWAASQGFTSTLPPADLHVTQIYSKEPVDQAQAALQPRAGRILSEGGKRSVETLGNQGAVVLRFVDDGLTQRYGDLLDAGARSDFPDYKSHITITYNSDGVDLAAVEPYRGPIELGPEVVEDIDGSFDPEAITETPLTPAPEPPAQPQEAPQATPAAQPEPEATQQAPVEPDDAPAPEATPAPSDADVEPDAAPDADSGSLEDRGASRREGRTTRPTGTLSPRFTDFSFNNRASVFQSALADAGIDADTARNMTAEAQIAAIAPMVEKKFGVTVELPKIKVQKRNSFGRRITVERTSITTREALDQLLDAYQNMQMLAAVMRMPTQAVGLPINGKGLTISLVSTRKLRGALGMFSWGGDTRVITMPGRSNSFAHEWGHAFDHFLNKISDTRFMTGMLSRRMDETGVNPSLPNSPRKKVTEAFASLMWAMFADGTQINALTISLQVDAAEVGADGKPTDKARRAVEVINSMREGRRPPAFMLSQYFQNAQAYDEMFGSNYFQDPAEMFARAFESWIGRTVGAMTDLPQSFLSKGNWAYDSNSDQRLEMTFPKGTDAQQFEIAMSKLIDIMGRIGIFTGPMADAPLATAISDNNDLVKMTNQSGLIGQEKLAMLRYWSNLKNLDPGAIRKAKADENAFGVIYNTMIASQAHMMTLITERQRTPAAREAFRQITSRVAKMRPGSGEYVGNLYQENVEMAAKTRIQKMQGAILKHFKGGTVTNEDKARVRAILIGNPSKSDTAAQTGLAAELRSLLTEVWYDLKDSGIDLSYQDGYLPRIYDAVMVDRDRAGFRAGAAKVYGLMFDKEVRQNPDPETQNDDIKSIINGLRNATKAMPDGSRAPDPRLSDTDETLIENWRKERGAYRAAVKSLEKYQAETTKPDAATVQAMLDKIDRKQKAAEKLLGEVIDMLGDRWSGYSAEVWESSLGVARLDDVGSVSPQANFLKGRVLPPEADVILADYMVDNDDPIALLSAYFFSAARRAEYAKAFGDDNSKLNNMLRAARDAGATAQEETLMALGVQGAAGRIPSKTPGWARFSSVISIYGAIQLMGLSAFTSLAEPLVTGLRTGRARDALSAVVEQVMLIPRAQRRQRLNELAKSIGMIAPYTMETVMENRMAADAMDMPRLGQLALNRFFIINGLTPLTNWQRVANIPIANGHILRALRDDVRGERTINSRLRDGVAGGKGRFSDGELNELGIAKEDRADLLAWLEGLPDNLPRTDDLFRPDGGNHVAAEIWMRAVNRLVSETIQNPLKTDRPLAANNPDLAMMYSLQSFIMAYTRNVIFRNLGRGISAEERGWITETNGKKKLRVPVKAGGKAAANAMLAVLPFGALMTGHVLTTILREALLNSEKAEDEWEEDPQILIDRILKRAFSQTGVLGRLDILNQMLTGIRYDTDLTTITSGAYLGATLRRGQTILEAFVGQNSPNTNTAEFNAAQAAYQLTVQPAIAVGLALLTPGGRVSDTAAAFGIISASSYDSSRRFAEMMVGPKDSIEGETYRSRGVDPPWWELGE